MGETSNTAKQNVPRQHIAAAAAYLWLIGFTVAVYLGSTREALLFYLAYLGLAILGGVLAVRVNKWPGIGLLGLLFIYPFFGFFFGPFVLVPIGILIVSLALDPGRKRVALSWWPASH